MKYTLLTAIILLWACKTTNNSKEPEELINSDSLIVGKETIVSDNFYYDSLKALSAFILSNKSSFLLDSVYIVENQYVDVWDTAFLYTNNKNKGLFYKSSYKDELYFESFEITQDFSFWSIKIGMSKEGFKEAFLGVIEYNMQDTLIIISEDINESVGVFFVFQSNKLKCVKKESEDFDLLYDRSKIINYIDAKK